MNSSIDVYSQLGSRIAYLRKQRKIAQLDLAIQAGVSKSYLCDLEKGRRNPSLLVLNRICLGLNITLEELFKGVVDLSALI